MSEHEAVVLGSMMLAPTVIDDVAEVISGADFWQPQHEAIFDAIIHLAHEGKPADVLAVSAHLGRDAAYLHELVGSVSVAASAPYYAEKIRDASLLRAVTRTGDRLRELGSTTADSSDAVLDVVNAARAELDALITDDATDTTNEQAVYDAIESLEAPLGTKTPWRELDNLISGWAPGMLYIAGARPGVGKTVFGIGAALDASRRGLTSVMFSLEMPKNELYLRMLSAVGSVDGQRMMHRSLRGDDDSRMAKAAAHIANLPLVVDDRSSVSLAQIRAKIRGVQRTRPVGLVVVDYLGLVKPPPDAPRHDRRVQVDAIAQGLKNLSRDLKVPVLALAQLNRGIEGRADKVPSMSDLRESGGIEAAADVVMLMHRVVTEDPQDLHVVVGKNRHGPQSQFHLTFRGEYSRAEDSRWNQGIEASA